LISILLHLLKEKKKLINYSISQLFLSNIEKLIKSSISRVKITWLDFFNQMRVYKQNITSYGTLNHWFNFWRFGIIRIVSQIILQNYNIKGRFLNVYYPLITIYMSSVQYETVVYKNQSKVMVESLKSSLLF